MQPDFTTLKPVADQSAQPDFSSLTPQPTFSPPVSRILALQPQAPQSFSPGSQYPSPIKPGAIGEFLTGSERGFGKNIADAITGGQQVQDALQASQDQQKFLGTMTQLRDKAVANGQDTTHWDNLIASHQAPGYEAPALPSSTDVALNAGGTLLDAASFGTYGAAKTAAMKTGELALKGAPTLATAGVKAAGVATDAAKTAAGATWGFTKSAALGKEGIKTLNQIADPIAKQFVPIAKGGGGKVFNDVVTGAQKAINSWTSTSKAELQAVKQQIPTDIKIGADKITAAVNDGILKSVQSNAAYHGIQGEASQIFKTPESLIHSGLLSPEEAGKVKGMVTVIKGWTDNSARGILNLKEQLAPFYKAGFNGSNNILSGIQKNLVKVVGDVHPEIKPALAKASATIDKIDEVTRGLMGATKGTTESKLKTIATSIDNPALKGYQHSLIEDLKNATGHDVMTELKGFNNYSKLFKKDFPTKSKTIIKNVLTRLAIGGAGLGGLGALGVGAEKIGKGL